MNRIFLLFTLILFSFPFQDLYSQNDTELSPEEFLKIFHSLENSPYIRFLEAIKKNDQTAIDSYLKENEMLAIVNSRSFRLKDMEGLQKILDKDWSASSSISYLPEQNKISYNFTETDAGNSSEAFSKFGSLYSLRHKTLPEFLEAVGYFDRSIVSFKGKTVYGYHKGVLSIFIIGDEARVVISNEPGDLFIGKEHSPIEFALKYDRLDIVAMFLSKGMRIANSDTVTIHKILKAEDKIFEAMFPYIDDQDFYYADGLNLLHLAVKLDLPDRFLYLLENGFDIGKRTETGMYCAHIAAIESPAVLAEIIRLDKDQITKSNTSGIQPLHVAAMYAGTDIVEVLSDSGADINCRNIVGKTPLMLASEYNNLRIVGTLIRKGANVALLDDEKQSHLHYAIKGKNCSTLYYCLRYKQYDPAATSFSELREFGKNNRFHCSEYLKLTKEFHMEFKFQLNSTKIGYEQASSGISGGYGVELSQRIFPYGDLSYSFNRLYVESGIRNTEELSSLETNDEHNSMYETNYFDNLFSLKLYPVHYLSRIAPYLRLGYDFRIIKESGLLGSSSVMMDDLTDIAANNYQALNVGIGLQIREPVRFSTELYYSYGLTDVNNVFPGSYNTFSFVLGLGF